MLSKTKNETSQFKPPANSNTLHKTIDKFAPAKKASRKEKRIYFKPWFSKSILKSITKKNSLFTKLHKNFTESNLEVYKKYRNTLNRTIKLAEETYYKETIDSAKGDSKKLWKIIDTLINSKNKEKNFPQKLDIEGKKFEIHKLSATI